MDNRFNTKDMVLIVLLLVLAGMIGLQMWSQDRHWEKLSETLDEVGEQRDAVASYERELAEYKRGQDAMRQGVEQLVEVLQQSTAQGEGPNIGEVAIDLGNEDFSDDPTFARTNALRLEDDYAEGDYYIDQFSATVKSLTPYIAGDLYSDIIDDHVLDTLVRVDMETLETVPWVAESWDVSDDGLTITFYMRDDVVFSDGHPMDAHDVVFTYDWVMNPEVAAPRIRGYLEKIESVEALDDHTVRFVFGEPYFSAVSMCGALDILPQHWVSRFTEDDYNEKPGLLMGSGPYMLEGDPAEWESGTGEIALVRNDKYWGPRPALDRVVWREVREPTAQVTSFRNREVDRLPVRPSQYRVLSTDEQLREQAQLYEFEYVSSGYVYIGWNQERNGLPTAFADRRVRQAMTLLINRDEICGDVYLNLANPATGPFHPLGWQADPTIEPWPYDPQRAIALLEEAGYRDRNGDGIRESADGEPLSITFIHTASGNESAEIAQRVQRTMRQAGVEFNPTAMDWPVMQQKLDDRDFDAIMLGWGGSVQSDVHQMFHSDQTEDGGDNYVHYVSPEADRLIEQARSTLDQEESQRLWRQVHAVLHEDQPYTFMFTRMSVVYIDRRVQNVEVTKVGLNRAWEYYVPGPAQLHSGD